MGSRALFFFLVLLSFSAFSAFAENEVKVEASDPGLVMNFYEDSCPQAEDIIKEQVKLLYKRHKNTAFSWLRNIFHDCAVQIALVMDESQSDAQIMTIHLDMEWSCKELICGRPSGNGTVMLGNRTLVTNASSGSIPYVYSCDASLLLDSTRRTLSEKETDRSFGLRNFRYLDTIKEAVERECPGVVSCADILVLSGRDGIVSLEGPYIPLKTGRRDGRKSRADILEEYLPDHNESMTVVLERFAAMGIDTSGVVALLGSHSVGRTHCVKLVHRLYPDVDPVLNPGHVEHMLHKCPDQIPDPKAVQYVRNDRGTPMVLDNNYYRNILDNKGLLIVDHQLATDKRTKTFVKKMAKSQDYFFKEFSRAITILTENNPLTGTKGEIRKQCNVANKHH